MRKNLSPLTSLWILNLILLLSYTIGLPGADLFKSSILEYSNIKSDPFDGAVAPIAYVPDWTRSANTNKSKLFADFSIGDFIEVPEYDTTLLSDDSEKKSSAILTRYTYPVVYMGSYRGNYVEYDGSHGAVDIRAPIGTPVLAIANAVVIKIKDTESGDGKYVILRHDNIDSDGSKKTYYSGYEHLSEIVVTEGTKVRRGDVIGKVGMTGITTTPHLHFQIDTEDAPFHIFWPYTFREASDLGLDFFGAINVGLGKEKMMRYTIHPMDFIKNHRFFSAAPAEAKVAIGTNTIKQTESVETKSTIVVDASKTPAETVTVFTGQTADPAEQPTTVTTTVDPAPVTVTSAPVRPIDPEIPFSDIAKSSGFYTATKYLADKNVTRGYDDGTFRVANELTRREAILLYARLFGIVQKEESDWEFTDVLPSDELHGYLASGVADGIIAKNTKFRPNDRLTRAEAITLLIRTAKLPILTNTGKIFSDVKSTHPHAKYINTFAKALGLKSGAFQPDRNITRGELAKILYAFDQRKK